MDHLVSQHPVVIELCDGSVGAKRDGDGTTRAVGIGDAAVDARASANMHVEADMGNGKLAVVGADGVAGAADPSQQVIARDGSGGFALEANVDGRAANGY